MSNVRNLKKEICKAIQFYDVERSAKYETGNC